METRTNAWNEAIENTVKFIGESAQAYKMMHLLSAKQYSYIYIILMYISLILSPMAGTLAAIEAAIDNPSIYISITICILSFIVTVITGILKFGRFHEKSEAHKIATSKYTSLEGNVRRQLQLYRDDRVPAHQYYEWLAKSFDDLFHGAPYIEDHIYKKYYKLSLEKGLVFPDRYDHFITVEKDLPNKFMSDIKNKTDIEITKTETPPDSPKNNIIINDQEDIEINNDLDDKPITPPPYKVQFVDNNETFSQDTSPKEPVSNKPSQDTSFNEPVSNKTSFNEPVSNKPSYFNEPVSNKPSYFNIFPRRKSVNTPLADFNRYGNSQMNYELRRFMNF